MGVETLGLKGIRLPHFGERLAHCDRMRDGLIGTRDVTASRVCVSIMALFLSGCAAVSEAVFADPAKFAMYDCEQLAKIRQAEAAKLRELEELMAKAATGTAGGLVAEVAYRPSYVEVQARLQSAATHWTSKGCHEKRGTNSSSGVTQRQGKFR